MVISQAVRGLRMDRRVRAVCLVIFALLLGTSRSEKTSWYCKDTFCSEPLSEGTAGYDYNPSEAAMKHGYLPVAAGQPVKTFKITNSPDIWEVEVNGKRGYIPRTLTDITTNYMDVAEYVVVDGPAVMAEHEVTTAAAAPPPSEEVKTVEEEKVSGNLPKEDVSVISTTPAAVEQVVVVESSPPASATPVADTGSVSQPLVANVANEKVVEQVEPSSPEAAQVIPPAPTAEEAAEPASPISAESVVTTPVPAASSVVVPPPPAPPVTVTTDVPESFHSTEDISHGLSVDPAVEDGNRIPDTDAVKHVAHDHSDTASSEPLKNSSSPGEAFTLPLSAAAEPETQKQPETTPSPVSPEPVAAVGELKLPEKIAVVEAASPTVGPAIEKPVEKVETAPVVQSSPVAAEIPAEQEVQPSVVSSTVSPVLSAPTTQLPPPVLSSDLGEMARKLNGAAAPPPTVSVPAVPAAAEPIAASPVQKHPEPKVVFQQADFRASLPGIYRNSDQPVISTRSLLNRHHHHHDHKHGHGAHGHDHGAHGHDHHHGDDHSHDDHSGHEHPHPPEEPERSNQVRPATVPQVPPTPEARAEVPTAELLAGQTESSLEGAVKIITEPTRPTPTFIAPEDATEAPVDYTQLVRDRMEGKTVPGLLTDEYKRDPSEGFPTPPPLLDPATATEAPRIPGVDPPGPMTELQAAIDANPRYSRRRLGSGEGQPHHHLGAGNQFQPPQLEAPPPPQLGHSHGNGHDHAHHDHSGHEHHQGHHHSIHGHDNPRDSAEAIGATVSGTCRAGQRPGVEGSCEEFDEAPRLTSDDDGKVNESAGSAGGSWTDHLERPMEMASVGWMSLVGLFETAPGWFRLLGMVILSLFTVISMLTASHDRGIRRDLIRGFEENDKKKDKELLALREDIQVLLQKQAEDLSASRSHPPPPPVMMQPPLIPLRPMPCLDCEALRRTIGDREQDLKDHRETHATLLSKNNDVDTQLRLMQKERDELKRQVEDLRGRFAEAERRNLIAAATDGRSNRRGSVQAEQPPDLSGRLQQLEKENSALRTQIQTVMASKATESVPDNSHRLAVLQGERDESQSNVRLLRQLLAEKEEEIRKMRTAEAAGGASTTRELQEKKDDLRSATKQVARLQQELESVKRDRETQLQIRCQTFRAAADKAQRDALMARQEAVAVRQQLEDVCRRHGEQAPAPPALLVQSLANGAMTPPGLMPSPPLMFAGLGFPSGPPPATLEAFKQQVLMQQHGQQHHSSGHSSPRSPDLENEQRESDSRRREKRNNVKKSRTLDFPSASNGNGKADHDDGLDDGERRRDRSFR
ncbi:hypothetical protein BV898_12582 [Hypsibius exemplaris]|uniref:SH3 domain-containing protein n=1 Tax=Hypsibius exemplaris TaxID=2072580 RepID=A0A1W0WD69_HYPEX|nr:hypothetical protein BV898_12582 [Hypsibius exemplaris]